MQSWCQKCRREYWEFSTESRITYCSSIVYARPVGYSLHSFLGTEINAQLQTPPLCMKIITVCQCACPWYDDRHCRSWRVVVPFSIPSPPILVRTSVTKKAFSARPNSLVDEVGGRGTLPTLEQWHGLVVHSLQHVVFIYLGTSSIRNDVLSVHPDVIHITCSSGIYYIP